MLKEKINVYTDSQFTYTGFKSYILWAIQFFSVQQVIILAIVLNIQWMDNKSYNFTIIFIHLDMLIICGNFQVRRGIIRLAQLTKRIIYAKYAEKVILNAKYHVFNSHETIFFTPVSLVICLDT